MAAAASPSNSPKKKKGKKKEKKGTLCLHLGQWEGQSGSAFYCVYVMCFSFV